MNNNAALGYMILAAKKIELPPRRISQLEETMRRLMDEKTEEEAIRVYKSF